MEIKDLVKIMPLKPTALSITIHNQAKALKSMASVVDRLEHQLNNMKRITIQKQEKLEEQMNRDSKELVVGRYLLFQKLYNCDGEMYKCDACIKNSQGRKVSKQCC